MAFPLARVLCLSAAGAALLGCGGAQRAPERCRNLVQNPAWEAGAAGWSLPPFAKLEEAGAGERRLVVEGQAEGAVAQILQKPADLAGLRVVAVGYARVETPHPLPATDDDITPQLWNGVAALVNGYARRLGGFESPYTPLRFTGREVASGFWKRFVTQSVPANRAKFFYPHFAFWQVRFAPGVKLQLAALWLVEAAPEDGGEPESWAACPALPAPRPVLESISQRQWAEQWEPDGSFDDSFGLEERVFKGEPGWLEWRLTARYRQGYRLADRFLVAVTEDGSDPSLSPSSRIQTAPAVHGVEPWETTVKVKKGARPIRIAVAGAALTQGGLRAQAPLQPAAWQRP